MYVCVQLLLLLLLLDVHRQITLQHLLILLLVKAALFSKLPECTDNLLPLLHLCYCCCLLYNTSGQLESILQFL